MSDYMIPACSILCKINIYFFQMHSNRPASEVVESHSYGSASVAASVSPASSVRKDVTQPMYHGQQVQYIVC